MQTLILLAEYIAVKLAIIARNNFNIETNTYRRWHNRRCRQIQRQLDYEHETNISGAFQYNN